MNIISIILHHLTLMIFDDFLAKKNNARKLSCVCVILYTLYVFGFFSIIIIIITAPPGLLTLGSVFSFSRLFLSLYKLSTPRNINLYLPIQQ